MKTYEDLFAWIAGKLENRRCDHTLRAVRQFARQHGLYYGELSQILEEMGGYCDCEVLINVADRIPASTVIGEEQFTTPVRLAIEQDLYSHCRVDGQAVSFAAAVAAKAAGLPVEWHVPCKKTDPHASPDVDRVRND